ncbi:DUF803-domain-containing protein [Dacryopinax primogenitus]|uniref:DUF803-domain-containing protein n=1 Tax=Dacryopinax primogenitus (strain DJM 731) TaxID=1858805 RepID=M5G0E2_DACPD|nr:DUF803-domain-containing protein [Dacryopinax primogenitus]EJT99301.1 DUF803-domain-containing protein [Dacryopinax primogenitus]
MEDRWIGLILAVLGNSAIGSSFIIIKMVCSDVGLNAAAERAGHSNASDKYVYLRNPLWWLGMTTMISGELMNFAAYAFAPPILVTPLGALSVIIGAVLASIFLQEELGHLGVVACTLCLLGSLIIVLHAPADKDIQTVDEILHYALQPAFLLYCLIVLIVSVVFIYVLAPKYGKKSPIIYLTICSLVGSVSVMGIKGFGIALKLTFAGNNQLTHPSTYVFGIVVVLSILVQMNYFNKALDIFSTNVVNPIYYVGFSTAVILASIILFQGFNTGDGVSIASLIVGFLITFLGVHLLNMNHKPDFPDPDQPHVPLEHGLMNPRLSISGRMSIDSPRTTEWTPHHTHRGGSGYRMHNGGSASGSGWGIGNGNITQEPDISLDEVREEEEEEFEGDETTRLTGKGRRREERRKSIEAGDLEAAVGSPHTQSNGRTNVGRI